MLAARENFEDTPPRRLGTGEMLPQAPPEPPEPQPTELQIEPPQWHSKLDSGDLDLGSLTPSEPPTERLPALDQLKLANDDIPEPPPWAPPMVTPPLERPRVPEPDWEAEQKARARRDPEPPPTPAAEPFFGPPPPWKQP
jgi:hypothetical protein